MSKQNVVLICVGILVLCAGSLGTGAYTRIRCCVNPDPKDWLTYGGSYNSQRYSLLKQVTTANASRLQAKWVYHVDGVEEGEVTPIVVNGVMYISGFNRLDAIDARSGNIIWQLSAPARIHHETARHRDLRRQGVRRHLRQSSGCA